MHGPPHGSLVELMIIGLKPFLTVSLVALVAIGFFSSQSTAAPFMAGSLVVCRIGNGVGGLGNVTAPVFIDEYSTTGTFVQSIAMPTTDAAPNQTLTASGSATTECLMTRSADGRYLFITGFDVGVGTTNPGGSSTATVSRTIGRVDFNGNVDTTTTTTAFSAQTIRGVVSSDGTNIWLSGGNTGVVYTSLGGSGAGTTVSSTVTNLRAINIFSGQLYTSSGSGSIRIATVGSGLPTTSGQTTSNLNGFPTSGGSYYAFYFADLSPSVTGLDTLYVADDGAGVMKYSLVGGSWTFNGTTPGGPIRGLTGVVQTSSSVTLYGTGTATNANSLVSIVDPSGHNADPFAAVAVIRATAATNTVFRGVAFAPVAPSAAGVGVSGRVLGAEGRGVGRVLVKLVGGAMSQPKYFFTNPFGYYHFEDLSAGASYVISVSSKQHTFAEPSRVITLNDGISELDFIAEPLR